MEFRGVSRIPKKCRILSFALGCLLELDDKTLLLKKLGSQDMEKSSRH